MPTMLSNARRLSLGVASIVAASAILLASDLDARRDALEREEGAAGGLLRVAVVQSASIPALDDGVRGIIAGLAARGFVEGERVELLRYNAQGDMSVANAIATEVTSASLDLIATASTVALQTVANANRTRVTPTPHVFGSTSDPFGAGVEVSRDDPLDHPAYMAGLGSLPPIRELFEAIRTLNPNARRVGLVWNPAEANSEAATRLGRAAAAEFGMELVEANAESATVAGDAVQSVLSRGVDVLWVSADVTVYTAVEVLITAARRAGIPVISSLTGTAALGSLLDMGASYEDIGYVQGLLAADVLEGRDPATMPVINWIPVELNVNLTALDGLSAGWRVPGDLVRRARVVIDGSGTREQQIPSREPPPELRWNRLGEGVGRPNVDVVIYMETPNAELSLEGVRRGLSESGIEPDRDVNLRVRSAQGDMATLVSIVDALSPRDSEVLITLSTPALQTALQRDRGLPIVFGMVSNPFIVGAGTTNTDHAPTVTGAYMDAPVNEALDIVQALFPRARTLGTLYTPAEINSAYNKDQLVELAEARGFSVEVVGVATAADVVDASIALAARRPDVWMQIVDNAITSSYPAVMEAANREGLPVITFATAAAEFGPLVIVGRDYVDAGVDAGRLTARVLRGESPASLPFVPSSTISYILNHDAARRFGVTFPDDLIALVEAQGP